jgi:hypothetical protein
VDTKENPVQPALYDRLHLLESAREQRRRRHDYFLMREAVLTEWTHLQLERVVVATTIDPAKHCHVRQRLDNFGQQGPCGHYPLSPGSDHGGPLQTMTYHEQSRVRQWNHAKEGCDV